MPHDAVAAPARAVSAQQQAAPACADDPDGDSREGGGGDPDITEMCAAYAADSFAIRTLLTNDPDSSESWVVGRVQSDSTQKPSSVLRTRAWRRP